MELQPFDRVLVRDDFDEEWRADFFESYSNNKESPYPYYCLTGNFRQCIPYSGNEKLLRTTIDKGNTSEFKFGDHVEVSDDGENWTQAVYLRCINDIRHKYYKYKCVKKMSYDDYIVNLFKYCRKADW